MAAINQTRKDNPVLVARLGAAIAGTLVLALLANQIGDIGGRIPYVFLVLWFGSATIVALVFVPRKAGSHEQHDGSLDAQTWKEKMLMAGTALVPLTLVPLLEVQRTGPDPMIWLMDIALLISICSTPYFSVLAGKVVSAVVLTWGAITVLWLPCATALFQVIKRVELAKDMSTVDIENTMHAFFTPEYRYLFYFLSTAVVVLYCPIMLLISYRSFHAARRA